MIFIFFILYLYCFPLEQLTCLIYNGTFRRRRLGLSIILFNLYGSINKLFLNLFCAKN